MKHLFLTLALVASVACKHSPEPTPQEEQNAAKAASFVLALNASVSTDVAYEVVKFGRDNMNYVVVKSKDASGSTTYFAVDIRGYNSGMSATGFMQTAPGYFNLTSNGNGTFSCYHCTTYGGASTSTTMVFERTSGSVKDLEKAAALAETYAVETMAENIAAEFGLSEERALKVAKLSKSWNKLSKTRALTNADADAFAKELAGVTIGEMQGAYEDMTEGSAASMNDVLERAAAVNGTSPENMSQIMAKLFF